MQSKMTSKTIIHNPRELITGQGLKFYTPIAMLFVTLLFVVNIISQKIIAVSSNIMLTAGDFIYPLDYVLSIILVEVYGYAMSRRVIWMAFICNMIVAVIILFAIALPASPSWSEQEQYAAILGRAPRLLVASFSAFLIGEFIGTYILAKVKILTSGKYLWFRIIGAAAIGQFIDSVIFNVISFANIISWHDMMVLTISVYWCKMAYQILMTPGIYVVARFLKKREHVDIFDRNTNFNPFRLWTK